MNIASAEREVSATLQEALPSGSVSLGYNAISSGQHLALGASLDTRSFQPSLSATYDFDYDALGNFPEGGSSNSLSFNIGLTIPLDSSLPDALAQADIVLQQAQLSYEQTLESAKLAISHAEQQLQIQETNVTLTEEVLAQAQDTLDISQQRFDLGLVSQLDVLRAELNLKEQMP